MQIWWLSKKLNAYYFITDLNSMKNFNRTKKKRKRCTTYTRDMQLKMRKESYKCPDISILYTRFKQKQKQLKARKNVT